jgi:hypothetical protein
MNDERLRQLYMQGLAARERTSSRAGPPCGVAPEELLALARGELGEDRRLELLDQVMVSERCRQELDLLRAVVTAEREALAVEAGTGATPAFSDAPSDEEEEPAEEPAGAPPLTYAASPPLRVVRGGAGRVSEPAPRRTWWRSGGFTAAVAATLLLAVGIRQFVRAGAERDELTRGEGSEVAVVAPANVVDAGAPVTFAWRPVSGATRYALDLSDAGGTAVYETTTRDTTVALPAAVALRPGAEYRWIVRATDDAGAPRGTAVRRLAVRTR